MVKKIPVQRRNDVAGVERQPRGNNIDSIALVGSEVQVVVGVTILDHLDTAGPSARKVV